MSDLKISNITPAVGNIKTGSTNVSKIYCGSTLVWPPTSIACVACSVGDVPIGTQIWTGCNLSVTTYSDGITPIPEKYSLSDWAAYPYGAWCWYGGETWCKEAHGRLYNWAAIKGIYDEASLLDPNLRKSIVPAGYHVPTDAEWTILSNYLSGAAVAGGKMKATGTIQGGDGWWDSPNTGATNESGFTAIAGGARADSGVFFSGTNIAWFWSSSEDGVNVDLAIGRSIVNNATSISPENRDKGWGMSVRLIKNSTPVAPAITTSPILSITQTTAVSGGSGIVDGGSAITAKGVCWSTTQNPTIALPTKTNNGTGTSTFASNITGLTAGITYYVRAYITNSVGVTTYGNQLSFVTTPAIVNNYGYLYNERIVDEPNFAPAGWRIPTYFNSNGTDGDWFILKSYLTSQGYGTNFAGVLKSTRTQPTASPSWAFPNTGATDIYGFNCLPAGYRASSGSFSGLTTNGSLHLAGYSGSAPYPRVWGSIVFQNNLGTWSTSANTGVLNTGVSVRFVKTDPNAWNPGDTITDNDGNVYETVKIGTQVWTKTNWKSTKYTNGATIPMLQDNTLWQNAAAGAMCYYAV